MAKTTNAFKNELVAFLFHGTTMNGLATALHTALEASLHTADPGASGTQSTSVAAYTGYAVKTIALGSGLWTLDTALHTAKNAALVTWPQCTGGASVITATHVGLSVAGSLKAIAALPTPLDIYAGIIPQAAIDALVFTAAEPA